MKTKKSGSTKGKSSAKRVVKDLPAKSSASVKGGWGVTITSRKLPTKLAF